jgi:hypothetical protein
MIDRRVDCAYKIAEIPEIVVIRVRESDSQFRGDRNSYALVESRRVQGHLAPQRMTDNADPSGIRFRHRPDVIDKTTGVPHPFPETG